MKLIITCLGLTLFALASCKKRSGSNTSAFFVPAQDQPFVSLGQGYNPSTGTFTAKACYDAPKVDMQKLDVEDADIKVIRNANMEQILNRLSGSLSLSYPIYPGVEAGGNVRLAVSNTSTDVSETFSLFNKVTYSQSLPPELQVSAFGKTVLEEANRRNLTGAERKSFIQVRCGEEIIDKVYYGTSYNILAEFNYGSSLSKQRFGAGLKLELLGGIATVTVDSNIINDAFAEAISLTMSVKQMGGQPEYITKLFPDGLPRCDYSLQNPVGWSDECKEALSALYSYGFGLKHPRLEGVPSFIDQARDAAKSLVPMAYETHPVLENDPMNLRAAKGFTLANDTQRSAAYQNRELAIRLALSHLEKIGGAEKAFNSLLASNASFQNLNAYTLYYQSILRQLNLVSGLKQELLKHIDECWKMSTPCTAESSQAKIAAIEAKYPYDMDLGRYNKLALSITEWCTLLGPEGQQNAGVFPRSKIFASEQGTLNTLFRMSGIKPAPVINDATEQDKQLAAQCGALEANLASRSKLDLSILATSGVSLGSARVVDFLPGLEILNLSDQTINSIPRFYGLPRLKSLIMRNSPFYMQSTAPAQELPASIRCLDFSAKDANVDITGSIRPEVQYLILRGWSLPSLKVPAGLKSLLVKSLFMETEDLAKVGATVDHDLEVRVSDDEGIGVIPVGTYGRINVIKDDNALNCESI